MGSLFWSGVGTLRYSRGVAVINDSAGVLVKWWAGGMSGALVKESVTCSRLSRAPL